MGNVVRILFFKFNSQTEGKFPMILGMFLKCRLHKHSVRCFPCSAFIKNESAILFILLCSTNYEKDDTVGTI